MLKLNNLWNYVKVWWQTRSYKTKIVAAHNWFAIYQKEDSYQAMPVVAWQVYCYQNIPIESIGLVFEDSKPPTLQCADDLDNFVGYQMRITGASSQLFSVPCYENN